MKIIIKKRGRNSIFIKSVIPMSLRTSQSEMLGFMLELSCDDAACLHTHTTESFVGEKIRASEVRFLFVGRQTMIFNKEKKRVVMFFSLDKMKSCCLGFERIFVIRLRYSEKLGGKVTTVFRQLQRHFNNLLICGLKSQSKHEVIYRTITTTIENTCTLTIFIRN